MYSIRMNQDKDGQAEIANILSAAAAEAAQKAGLELFRDEDGLAVRPAGGTDEGTFRGDFGRMLPRLRQNNLEREFLVRAARLKHFRPSPEKPFPVVLDAAAGMGEDALLLAAAGFQVGLYEKDPVIAALLADTMKRAAAVPELAAAVSRMEMHFGDSIPVLRDIAGQEQASPDVIYLDPMFPERTKSAMVKRKFQTLHLLEQPCDNEEELLGAAIAAKPQRIVIKRPVKGADLGGRKPDFSYAGKAVRYDVLINLQ